MRSKRMFAGVVIISGVVGILGFQFVIRGGATTTTPDVVKTAIRHALTRLGDDHPLEVTYVESTRGTAMDRLAGAPTDDDRPVYVIQLRGVFVASGAYVPPGNPLPTGSVATVVVDKTTGETFDFGVNNLVNDLASLGDTHKVEDMGF